MTQEEKELLLRDISARLQSGLKVCCINLSDEMPKVWDLIGMPALHLADVLVEGAYRFAAVNIEENIRPYLRPLSSMTEEEKEELKDICTMYDCDMGSDYECFGIKIFDTSRYGTTFYSDYVAIDWLNKKMFDYRGLIPKGLALYAPKDMYDFKTE